jgi:hypothetical protein
MIEQTREPTEVGLLFVIIISKHRVYSHTCITQSIPSPNQPDLTVKIRLNKLVNDWPP